MDDNSKIIDAIKILEESLTNPKIGLPEEIFLFISRLTPMVNVDLLIKDKDDRVLLAWRDDKFAGRGWHVPGGIIRYKEEFNKRINEVIKTEIGTNVIIKVPPKPTEINQIICEHNSRGHFISLLFLCKIENSFVPENKGKTPESAGFLKWHKYCPNNLVKVQSIYKKYF